MLSKVFGEDISIEDTTHCKIRFCQNLRVVQLINIVMRGLMMILECHPDMLFSLILRCHRCTLIIKLTVLSFLAVLLRIRWRLVLLIRNRLLWLLPNKFIVHYFWGLIVYQSVTLGVRLCWNDIVPNWLLVEVLQSSSLLDLWRSCQINGFGFKSPGFMGNLVRLLFMDLCFIHTCLDTPGVH